MIVENLDQFGLLWDVPSPQRPHNSFGMAENWYFRDGAAIAAFGYGDALQFRPDSDIKTLADPSVFALEWPERQFFFYLTASNQWHLLKPNATLSGLEDVTINVDPAVVFQNNTVRDNTPDSELWAANWHGFVFNQVPVFNNGSGVPFYYNENTNTMLPIPGWPLSAVCRVLEPFTSNLVAGNIIDSEVVYDKSVWWSDVITIPGVLPGWDFLNVGTAAGKNQLDGYAHTPIVAMRSTTGFLNIYTKTEVIEQLEEEAARGLWVWRVAHADDGAIGVKSVANVLNGQVSVTPTGNIVFTDNNTKILIGQRRFTFGFFEEIDPAQFNRITVLDNPGAQRFEVYYPTGTGSFQCLLVSYQAGGGSLSPQHVAASVLTGLDDIYYPLYLESGVFTPPFTFDTQPYLTFDNIPVASFNEFPLVAGAVFANGVVGVGLTTNKLFGLHAFATNDGRAIPNTLRCDYRSYTEDSRQVMRVERVQMHVTGVGEFVVRIGTSNTTASNIEFKDYKYDSLEDPSVYTRAAGRYITYEFQNAPSGTKISAFQPIVSIKAGR